MCVNVYVPREGGRKGCREGVRERGREGRERGREGGREGETCVKLSRHHLGGSVVWAATRGTQELSVCHEVAQSKVGNLDVVLSIEKQVLRLQVSVDNFVTV